MMEKRKYLHAIIMGIVFMLSSCSNPIHRQYNSSTYDDDMQAIRKSNAISDGEEDLLDKYILLAKLSGNDLSGKSYDDLLDNIKVLQEKNTQKGAESIAMQDARRQRLSAYLEIKLENKVFLQKDAKNTMSYTLLLKNTGAIKIKTVTGNLIFFDLLDRPFKSLPVFIDEDITARKELMTTINLDYNDADNSDRIIRMKDINGIRTEWYPEKIIFENGRLAE